jgi:COP9 signalosome complex subunit 1
MVWNYKHNTYFRRGFDSLGDHYLDCGDLSSALKMYTRARDHCTSSRHIVALCLNIIKVSVLLGNWQQVLNYYSKAEATHDIAEVLIIHHHRYCNVVRLARIRAIWLP